MGTRKTRAWTSDMTPPIANRSTFVHPLGLCAACIIIFIGCMPRSDADTTAPAAPRPGAQVEPAPAAAARAPRETCLGVADHGIWSDLDDEIQIDLPAGLTADRVIARIDPPHGVLVLSIDGVVRKIYPLGGPARLAVGDPRGAGHR